MNKISFISIGFLLRLSLACKEDMREGPNLSVIYDNSDKTVASYIGFDLHTRCEGDLFVNDIKLTYTANNIDKKARELIFRVPLPPNVIVRSYTVRIGDGTLFESVVYPIFIGEKTYNDAKVDETCGKAEVTQDILTISIKIPIQTLKGEPIVFNLHWQQFAIQNYHPQHGLCYEFTFPRRSYFKFGSEINRTFSDLVANQYGIANTTAVIDLRKCHFDLIESPSDFKPSSDQMVYELNHDEKESRDNIRFQFINKKNQIEPFDLFTFNYDGYNVLGFTFIPHLLDILNGLEEEKENILVVDKSESMSWCIDGVTPYRIVSLAIDHLLTFFADTNIYINIVAFNHDVDTPSDILFHKSEKIITPGLSNGIESKNNGKYVNDVKVSIKNRNMFEPSGGTNIYAGIHEAIKLPRIINDKGHVVPRNIILITDGGDSNLSKIRKLVEKEASTDSVRFFSVGIGNGVSFDIIETVGNVGKGSVDYIWNLKDVKTCFFQIAKNTGIKPVEFCWDVPNSQESVLSLVKKGKLVLGDSIKALHVPSYVTNYTIFPTKCKTLFCVYKGPLPEVVVFKIDGKEMKKHSKDIKDIDPSSEKIMSYLFSIEFDNMLEAELKKKIDASECEKIYSEYSNYSSLKEEAKREERIKKCLEDSLIVEQYTEKIDFEVTKEILTKDTLLMTGNEIKRDFEWRSTADVKNYLFDFIIKDLKDKNTYHGSIYTRSSSYKSRLAGCGSIQTCGYNAASSGMAVATGPTRLSLGDQYSDTFEDEQNSVSKVFISDHLFESFAAILESKLSINEMYNRLRKLVAENLRDMTVKLDELIIEINSKEICDAGKIAYLTAYIYAQFIPEPDDAQKFTALSKMLNAKKFIDA